MLVKKKKKNFRAKMESFQIDINRIKPFRCKSMKIIIYTEYRVSRLRSGD